MDNLDFDLNDPDVRQIMDNQYNNDSHSLDSSGTSDSSILDFDEPILHEDSLLINAKINNFNLKFLIDSSCKNTMISYTDALKFKIIDTDNGDYLNKINNVNVLIDSEVFNFSITIVRDESQIPILGLDNLKKYRSVINIEANYLKIGTQSVMFSQIEIENYEYTENYKKLSEFGFEKNNIIDALKSTNNNFDEALNRLT